MIDTQAIRTKILDLAMRGKLTEQRADEKVVLGRGERLFTAAAARGDTRSPIPYVIPDNWKWVRVADVITKDVGGGTPSKSEEKYWKNGSIPWMSVKDFSAAQNGVLEDTIDHITPAGLANSSSNLVDVDAIIICMRMALGKIVKLKRPMAINQDLRAIWLDSCVDRHFFVFYYSTLKVEGHGMTVAGITKKQLMEFLFPLPPLAEQQRIVERIEQTFSALDTIDTLQAQYADNLTVLKSKLIDAAIQGKLTEQLPEDGTAEGLYQQIQAEKQALIKSGKIKKEKPLPEISANEIPFEIPTNWKWVRLGTISESVNVGIVIRPTRYYVSQGQGTPAFRNCNIQQGFIDDGEWVYLNEDAAKENPRAVVKDGDILVARSGTPGNCCIVTEPYSGRGAVDIVIVRLHQKLILPDFIKGFLCSSFAQKAFLTMSRGVALSHLGATTVALLTVPLPPLAEQKRIVQYLSNL